MRYRALLRSTLDTIKAAGGAAHIVRDRRRGFSWRAGTIVLPGPTLNDQSVRDLIIDGWLREDAIAGTAALTC